MKSARPAEPASVIVVVAAVIELEDRFLVTRRLAGTHLAGLWEFPGGKCEPGEGHAACLARELREELGVAVRVGEEILKIRHTYPDRAIELHFLSCELLGPPRPQNGQGMLWVARADLPALQFPPADAELIRLLMRETGKPG